MALDFDFTLDGQQHAVGIHARRPALALTVDGTVHHVEEHPGDGDGSVVLVVDGIHHRLWRCWEGDQLHLRLDGRSFVVGYTDAISAAQRHAGGDDTLRADMPGVVVALHCAPDAAVEAGDVLLVIESMKMQINIVAHRAGRIDGVHVVVNQSFDKGAALVSMHAQAAP